MNQYGKKKKKPRSLPSHRETAASHARQPAISKAGKKPGSEWEACTCLRSGPVLRFPVGTADLQPLVFFGRRARAGARRRRKLTAVRGRKARAREWGERPGPCTRAGPRFKRLPSILYTASPTDIPTPAETHSDR